MNLDLLAIWLLCNCSSAPAFPCALTCMCVQEKSKPEKQQTHRGVQRGFIHDMNVVVKSGSRDWEMEGSAELPRVMRA